MTGRIPMPVSAAATDVGGPAQPLVIARDLIKHFPLKSPIPLRKGGVVRAVDGVSFDVLKGETLGVVGESGCGKSTTARLLMQLTPHDSGELIFDAQAVGSAQLPMKAFRSQVQMVFQDSYSSLNPRLTIEESIAYGPRVHGIPAAKAKEIARELLAVEDRKTGTVFYSSGRLSNEGSYLYQLFARLYGNNNLPDS
ncbi:ATP-binding cassette domain-containing protein, partial [Cupriavidus pauculus]|uniref:ATP-binding cassette domain-containing protein n=1 Tax=Cupriavidus pauculus TaxID=82633 RepID=UPI0030FA3DF1